MSTHLLHTEKKHPHPETNVQLAIGEWRELFTESEYKLIIAESLNETVVTRGFHTILNGYLITKRRVCLVLHGDREKAQAMLDVFYRNVKKQLLRRLHAKPAEMQKEIIHRLALEGHEGHRHLFREFPLYNYVLVRLITGRPAGVLYYSPHVERLKERIRNYPYCSAIDYSGAKGPVIVTTVNLKN
ncbi:MAG TPA: hypothetical protein VFU15_01505 [Bacteroidia bacterium]|nr:hypothetical protein [Bacteroidia bacterium]